MIFDDFSLISGSVAWIAFDRLWQKISRFFRDFAVFFENIESKLSYVIFVVSEFFSSWNY
jgi:hypothetical protein